MIHCVSGKLMEVSVTTVINCRINWQTAIGMSNVANIVVERSSDGTWTVSVSNINGILWKFIGTDNAVFQSVVAREYIIDTLPPVTGCCGSMMSELKDVSMKIMRASIYHKM